jgi:hypothetical protein
VHTRPAVYFLVGVVVIGCALVTWAWFALRANEFVHGRVVLAPRQIPVADALLGGINQTLINVDTTAGRIAQQKRQQLSQWGWIDRERGIVQLPIEAAMQALVDTTAASRSPR